MNDQTELLRRAAAAMRREDDVFFGLLADHLDAVVINHRAAVQAARAYLSEPDPAPRPA